MSGVIGDGEMAARLKGKFGSEACYDLRFGDRGTDKKEVAELRCSEFYWE